MIHKTTTNLPAAFELLLEEIETEIELVNQAGAKAFTEGLYDRVDAARQQATRLTEYRGKVVALRKEWESLPKILDNKSIEDRADKKSRRDFGRLPHGTRAPEAVFRLPILQVLVKMGGSGRVKDVLGQVEELVKTELSEADYQYLSSTPHSPRWYNTAQWARNAMRKEGLLKDDSPLGVWEISDVGRRLLATSK